MEKKGITDILKKQRITPKLLQEELKDKGAPGNWDTYQNVYNLISGCLPRDAYVFLVLSRFLGIDLDELLMRYSKIKNSELNQFYNQESIVNQMNEARNQDFSANGTNIFLHDLQNQIDELNYKLNLLMGKGRD